MADHSERIAEIQNLLRSGVTEVIADGVKTVINPASLRRELQELMAEDDTNSGRRPTHSSIYLGGF